MKKLFLCWLILYAGTGNIFLLQILKIPDLIVHYNLHSQSKEISIVDFFAIHYNGKDVAQDEDMAADNGLPFKSVVAGEKTINSLQPETDKHLFLFTSSSALIFVNYTADALKTPVTEIFQPPRC